VRKTMIRLVIALAMVGIGVWIGTTWHSEAEGVTVTPGSVDDPLVTKSYVDQKMVGGVVTKPPEGPAKDDSGTVKIVTVKNGQTLIAKDGAQIVVRAGKAAAYSEDTNGIADVTSGEDIKNGANIQNNHLLLFPRGGRGLSAAPGFTGSLTVMVDGGYELKS
jgi:hypothetical protein